LILTGPTQYLGAATVSAGATLQIGNGGTTGSVNGTITDNGSLIYNRSDDSSINSVPISGTGSLTKLGAGTLTVLVNNNYTGGTTISAGTLQIGNGGSIGSMIGNIVNNAALVLNRSDTSLVVFGNISGTGTLTKLTAGTAFLYGANTFTGGTTISAGTLQVGNASTTGSITGDILNNGALIFNRTDASTYAGNLSGSGTLTKSGTGTLSLTGASTHAGGTTITAGTLQIGSGGTTGSITGNIVDKATLAFNRSDALTYGGVVSGTGALTKLGAGTLTLTGANTYTGVSTISAGTLQIGKGATSG
jgi:autotransporter-associated beta strand protein